MCNKTWFGKLTIPFIPSGAEGLVKIGMIGLLISFVTTFTTADGSQSPPTCTTNAATNITYNSAKLNGTVNPNGLDVTCCYFDYGTSQSYGSEQNVSPLPECGTSPVSVFANISSLSADTLYNFRVVATNTEGSTNGSNLTFTTLVAPPAQVGSPNPSTGATNVPTNQQLSWGTASGATSYNVHFGTNSPGTYRGNQTGTTYNPGTLTHSVLYYWRIDSVNAGGTTTGIVWSFTTEAGAESDDSSYIGGTGDGWDQCIGSQLPAQVGSPTPADTATNVPTYQQLCWGAALRATSYDVYFGTTSPGTFQTNTTNTYYAPGSLLYATVYYWRIDSVNAGGTTTGIVWSFTTVANDDPSYIGGTGDGWDQHNSSPLPQPPTCTTNAATNITYNSATLNGTVNPKGLNVTSCYFDYGTSQSYGSQQNVSTLPGSGTSPVSVSANISSLSDYTQYNFRVVATNAEGTTNGSNLTFITVHNSPPVGTISINNGALATSSTSVTLTLYASDPDNESLQMCFRNEEDNWSAWENYATSKEWTLTAGDGTKTVSVKYIDTVGNYSTYSDTIIKDTTPPNIVRVGFCTITDTIHIWKVIIDERGVDYVTTQVRNDQGVLEAETTLTRVTGTATAGLWAGEITLPSDLRDGKYTLTDDVQDIDGNLLEGFYDGQVTRNTVDNKVIYSDNPKKGPDPIFLNNGEFFQKTTDLTIPGRGFPFQFNREYRAWSLYNGPLGVGWDFNYNAGLERTGDSVEYYDILGKPKKYPASDLGFISSPDKYNNFSYDEINNQYTMTETDGTIRLFTVNPLNENSYALKSITDRNNNTMTFNYGDNPNKAGDQYVLLTITDTLGSVVTFTWNADNRISYFEDWIGRRVSFTYDGQGDLISVTHPATTEYPNGNTTQYTYSSGDDFFWMNHNMLTITDPNNNTYLTNVYDDWDRVTTQTYGDGYFTNQYVDATESTPKKTIVTDRENNVVEYWFDSQDNIIKEIAYADPDSFTKEYEHTPVSGSIKTILPNGNSVEKIWDVNNEDARAQANVLQVIKRTAENQPISVVFAYEPYFNQIQSITNAMTKTTNFYFDFDEDTLGDLNGDSIITQTKGNLVKISYPDVTLGLAASSTTQTTYSTFRHNEFGQITQSKDPQGYVTDYTYYTTGNMKGRLENVIKDVEISGARITNSFEYDAVGNITSVFDGKSNETTFTVNELNQVKETVSRLGLKINFYYDANKNLEKMEVENRDKDGNLDPTMPWITTTLGYNSLDKPISRTATISSTATVTTLFGYDKNTNETLLTQPEGNQVKKIYDERDLLVEVIRGFGSADESSTKWEYDDNGNPKKVIDGKGNETEFLADGYDRIYGYIDAQSNRTEQELDAAGNVTRVTRKNSSSVVLSDTKYLYDELNRNYETQKWCDTTSSWVITQYEFDKNSRMVRVVDNRSNQMTISYNGFGAITKIEDQLDNKIEYGYDNNMNVTVITETETSGLASPEVYITVNQYDNLDRPISSTNQQLSATRFYGFDSRNNLVYSKDREGNTINRVYDGINRLTQIVRDMREGGKGTGSITGTIVTQYQWDDNSRLEKLIDPRSKETSYAYDAVNRPTSETLPDSTYKTFTYDDADNIISIIDNNGTTVEQVFDTLNRLTNRNITRGTGVLGVTAEVFGYDGLSRLTDATNSDGATQVSDINLTYDTLSRMTQETQQIGTQSVKTIASQFDSVGNRTQLTYPSSKVVVFEPDALDRIAGITQNSQSIAEYSYAGPWRVKGRTYGNNTALAVTYDTGRRITGFEHENTVSSTLIAGFEYAFDKENHKLFEKRTHDSNKGDAYVYDSIYQLTGVKYGEQNLSPSTDYADYENYDVEQTFTLDNSGNRTQVISGTETTNYTVNDLNQYTQISGTNLAYDNNGNLISDSVKSYIYDYANRLIEVISGTTIATFKYDALGRRIEKTTSETMNYYFDGIKRIEERNISDTVIATYTYGINEVLTMERDSETYYYHQNTQGSIYAITNNDGEVVERYKYDVYGKPIFLDPEGNSISQSLISNHFLFAGMEYDIEAELYYTLAGNYSLVLGRFINPSGINELSNKYTAANNNTVNNKIVVNIPGLIAGGIKLEFDTTTGKLIGIGLVLTGPKKVTVNVGDYEITFWGNTKVIITTDTGVKGGALSIIFTHPIFIDVPNSPLNLRITSIIFNKQGEVIDGKFDVTNWPDWIPGTTQAVIDRLNEALAGIQKHIPNILQILDLIDISTIIDLYNGIIKSYNEKINALENEIKGINEGNKGPQSQEKVNAVKKIEDELAGLIKARAEAQEELDGLKGAVDKPK
ncbi:MAG: DUF6531 domain-containing protein [Planctomycetota bacterium]